MSTIGSAAGVSMMMRSNCARSASIVRRIVVVPSSSAGCSAPPPAGSSVMPLVSIGHERLIERRAAGEHVDETDRVAALSRPNISCSARRPEVRVDDAGRPLILARHRQREIGGRHALAVAAARARDALITLTGAALIGVHDPRAQRRGTARAVSGIG